MVHKLFPVQDHYNKAERKEENMVARTVEKAQEEARKAVDGLLLTEVKRLLEEAILRKSRKQ